MFNRDNNNNDNLPPIAAGQSPPERPTLPPCRTWKVRRWKTNTDRPEIEDVFVSAHGITHADPNGDIIFSRLIYVMSPQGPAVSQIPVRAFSSYYDYELVEEGDQTSPIIH